MTDPFLEVSAALRLVSVGLLLLAAALLARAWVRGVLPETLAYSVLSTPRRSGVTTSIMLLAICLAVTGVLSAAMNLNWMSPDVSQPIGSVTFLVASLGAFALVWIGLSTRPEKPKERMVLDVSEGLAASVGTLDRSSRE